MRRYLIILLVAALLPMAAALALTWHGLRTAKLDMSSVDLYRYQVGKLKTAARGGTVFVGDSSLGNGVDAAEWSRLSGAPALNLALTGGYGYGGPYNVARRATATAQPRRIVLVSTIEMMQRETTWRGYIITAGRDLSRPDLPAWEMFRVVLDGGLAVNAVKFIFSGGRAGRGIVNDYMRQTSPLDQRTLPERARRLEGARINPDQALFLRRLAEFCRTSGIECLYAHGPVAEPFCRLTGGYIARATAEIERTGLKVVAGTPICLPAEDVGCRRQPGSRHSGAQGPLYGASLRSRQRCRSAPLSRGHQIFTLATTMPTPSVSLCGTSP
jgi:hypothetical protein